MELTYHEKAEILDTNYIDAKSTGYTRAPEIYEISDIVSMLKSLFPDEVKVHSTIDIICLRSILSTNKRIKFTKKSFFYTIIGFTQSHSSP